MASKKPTLIDQLAPKPFKLIPPPDVYVLSQYEADKAIRAVEWLPSSTQCPNYALHRNLPKCDICGWNSRYFEPVSKKR
jgi:hypothetical protein